ncbi:hypothetical protein S40285_06081 [Stachybotrys chlorohalonatus IBT 40285]|uniref:Uncharacterized protein n=2 Tax=Stachybotrys TaxID=74721 RepID=A0A084QEP7_STAC4|nr:hypothetical protein S40285_06081 [Stachybotrys chlorohalonata IBT 40285]
MYQTRLLFLARPLCRMASRPAYRPSVTIRSFASPAPPNMAEQLQSDPQLREMMEKLSRHPGAIVAMQNIAQIVKDKGFEPGQTPSKMEMMKLLMDGDFRKAAQELNNEMQKAGVEINPDSLMKMMGK